MLAAQSVKKQATTPAHTFTAPNKHMPGLDVVRGIAILAVLFFHGFVPEIEQLQDRLPAGVASVLSVAHYGALGVHLFFVLSGFLITGILLDTRGNADYYKTFYIRRILRIVPAYVLMLIVLRATHTVSWTFTLVAALYLVNMSHNFTGDQGYPSLWSLSVEEQFYLVWPIIIRKLRVRYSFYLALLLVISIPFLRFFLLGTTHFNDIHFKVWSVSDFFAGGAVMSMLIRSSRTRPYLKHICIGTFLTSLAGFGIYYSIVRLTSAFAVRATAATQATPWVLFFSSLILFAYMVPAIASIPIISSFLTFLGYISYGLYLCHSLIQHTIEHHWTMGGLTGEVLLFSYFARFFVWTSVAIAISYLSRRTFEDYFLKLKPRQREVVPNLQLS